jgi:hypothetical protein
MPHILLALKLNFFVPRIPGFEGFLQTLLEAFSLPTRSVNERTTADDLEDKLTLRCAKPVRPLRSSVRW